MTMKVLVLYQGVQSGSKIATESIVRELRGLYPESIFIVYQQCPQVAVSGPLSFLKYLLWSMWDFRRVINQKRSITCVYSTMYTAIISQWLSKKRQIPSIFHVHGDQRFGREPNNNLLRTVYRIFLGRIVILLQKLAVHFATRVCFVSSTAQHEFLSRYHLQIHTGKSTILPNGVDTKKFFPSSRARPHDRHKPTLLYVGRIDEKKGIHRLMHSLEYLRALSPRLVVAYPSYFDRHSASYFSRLQGVAERVAGVTISFVKNPKNLTALYHGAHCIILPSTQEMAPLVVLEALACGTPLLCANVGGISTMLGPLAFYCVLPSDRPVAIAEAIKKTLSFSPKLRAKLQRDGVMIASKYSWRATAKNLYALIAEITQPW
ncbi:glycosyltransferase family 4 protein [Patescibacteria group bacterium]|nr:glycosyltransferase family 4 protein [Patescibacteria group bacterium]MBU1472169.1 glycosyltransferase family 4 protein [Patescibacteria group bacterium]MBU2459563.1 glycosyltransferase family 4 protein [Patescibacteria group bacterium]MBU2544196.1 glycosyltransferase family 4 protein [Patescibacteria group bacterium]